MSAHEPAQRPTWKGRCLELVEEFGEDHKRIAATLNAEGYTTKVGKPYTSEGVRKSLKRTLKEAAEARAAGRHMELSEKSEASEKMKGIRSEASEASDTTMEIPLYQSADEPLPDTWKAEIINLIRGELAIMQTSQTLQKTSSIELAPMPTAKVDGLKHRKVNPWERVKVGVTLDKALSDLLEAKRKELGDVSLSRALDTVLWQYFGKPPLSFEVSSQPSQESQTEPDEAGQDHPVNCGEHDPVFPQTRKMTAEEIAAAMKS